jgi:hypothetical protein
MQPADVGVANITDAGLVNYSRLTYPNPTFDLSRHYSPKSVKSLFRYCRYYFRNHEYIHNIILKLAEYPITDLIFENLDNIDIRNNYQEILNHYLKIKQFLVDIGLDYFVYGNCLVSVNMEFKRFLKCPTCKTSIPFRKIKTIFQDYSFKGKCSICGADQVKFSIEDSYLQGPEFFKFIRWNPESVEIDYDELTGNSRYFYSINEQTKKAINAGKIEVLERVPKIFLESLKDNKKIELDSKNLYHFKRPTLAEDDRGFGPPILQPLLKTLWYMQMLRRGNEAIVAEHLIPNRAVSPAAAASNLDPFTSMNLGEWASQMQENINKWKRDPNYIGIFPIPIQYQSLGGDAKLLMLTPELKFLEEGIINNFGVPTEFIKGGSTWTSSSVSLRIVENHFLGYRELLEDFLNYFALPKLQHFLKLPKVRVRFKRFKMSDDASEKEILMNLLLNGKISQAKFQTEMGWNVEEERALQRNEIKEQIDIQTEQAVAQVEAQGKSSIINARYQAQSQFAFVEASARVREQVFVKELMQELQDVEGIQDPSDLLQKWSIELSLSAPEQQKIFLEQVAAKYPRAFGFLQYRLQLLATSQSYAPPTGGQQ